MPLRALGGAFADTGYDGHARNARTFRVANGERFDIVCAAPKERCDAIQHPRMVFHVEHERMQLLRFRHRSLFRQVDSDGGSWHRALRPPEPSETRSPLAPLENQSRRALRGFGLSAMPGRSALVYLQLRRQFRMRRRASRNRDLAAAWKNTGRRKRIPATAGPCRGSRC